MAEVYDYVPSAAAQETAYRIVCGGASVDPPVDQDRVLELMTLRGYDNEETRRALQRLLAVEAVRVGEDGIQPNHT
ncbi:hypothetical protein [Halobaculum sp. MBLA0143]|uniref:hypothetical protein n=1 Tax=Halobaculum sp. MBLA0143 TaxID=3079933 RepID=UPI003523FA60